MVIELLICLRFPMAMRLAALFQVSNQYSDVAVQDLLQHVRSYSSLLNVAIGYLSVNS